MNQTVPNPNSVGVIVGRFQVPDLHAGHLYLIDYVKSLHEDVLIVVGESQVRHGFNNPLDFESRRDMILKEFPEVSVISLPDFRDDVVWCEQLDYVVLAHSGDKPAFLYGSRDSFIGSYAGVFTTVEIEPVSEESGTEHRGIAHKEPVCARDWRSGVIWASQHRYPTVYTTVDIAVFRPGYQELLLGRKHHQREWCLIGGFADPTCLGGFEEDARREVFEEAGVSLSTLTYVTSTLQDDWRYRNERDKIKTILFMATTNDHPVAGDDIEEVRWFPTENFSANLLVDCHQGLVQNALSRAASYQYNE